MVTHTSRPRLWLFSLLLVLLQLGACATGTGLSSDEQAAVAGRTFVVTGASSGFGRGVALKLAAMRANVVLAARRGDVLEDVARQAFALGGTPVVVATDVSKPEDVQNLAERALARFGRIDVWINNAAVGAIGLFDNIPVQDHDRVIDVNVKGVLHGSHVALRQFKAQGGGALVNIGSVESEVPLAYHASYSASKAAVLALGHALNQELRLAGLSDSITVSTVMPWAADTPFFTHAANHSGGTLRMAAMDDAQKVVDGIVWVCLHPRAAYPVGWKARAAVWSHHAMPRTTERISANVSHRMQIETAPPAPPTSGSLYRPMDEGTGVDGGVRERMARENRERETLRKSPRPLVGQDP
ncbi:SDR family NAD(P)-dependent oxidoreductase [Aquabacterium sp.]|uniref:SDR family NAD(P)-dependent oxidoreductase n=1 Tax=Aquabacterium sp. TaxID=1872578 RepID=UPI003D6CCE39